MVNLATETHRCGSWPSPISADLVAAGGVRVEALAVRGDDVWWQETRPLEHGRSVLVSALAGDRLPSPWSARSRVHEYGGGSWWFGREHAYFVEAEDQAVYRIPVAPSAEADPTPERVSAPAPTGTGWRFADGREHADGSLIVCVREAHRSEPGDHEEPPNDLVAIGVDRGSPKQPQVLVAGPDFVSDPRISPDGTSLSWIQWNHPNMPWNETELRVAPLLRDGGNDSVSLGPSTTVASGVSISGPAWTADGRLVYGSDVNGFWNLHWWRPDGVGGSLTGLTGAEIGAPAWVFGTQRWVELPDGRLAAVVTRDAVDTLSVIEADGTVRPVPGFGSADGFGPDTPVAIGSISAAGPSASASVCVVAATPTGLPEVARVDVDSGSFTVIRPAAPIGVESAWLSVPESIWFDSDGRPTQAFFYRPTAGGTAMADPHEKPPLIVIGHGGPTAHNSPELSLKIQYWTSRGFAVVDVNYGGSTGFGKLYRDRLHQSWGEIDVDDCINAALHLAAEGLVDGDRLAIRGSSSGGLTVLAALIRSDRFAAGVSLYGVADLKALAADTHKFESRYLDWLIGPYPEEIERYESRSPVNDATAITTPMLLMQGTEDRVVPPSQSEAVVAALAANGVDHVYVTFDGESHGFRRAESIVSSLELELWFYGQVFGFTPADPVTAPDTAVGRGFGLDEALDNR